MMKPGDVLGKRTLVRRVEGRGRPCWLTRCVCGREKVVREHHLANGLGLACLPCARKRQGEERCAP
jgi:hypothetical protein